jgi:hypothetical protein
MLNSRPVLTKLLQSSALSVHTAIRRACKAAHRIRGGLILVLAALLSARVRAIVIIGAVLGSMTLADALGGQASDGPYSAKAHCPGSPLRCSPTVWREWQAALVVGPIWVASG